MAPPTPNQVAWRSRVEAALRIAAPALNLVLLAGDRLSRRAEPDDLDWVPPRVTLPAGEARRPRR